MTAISRRESCAKTSTWWVDLKGGKGTQQPLACQAHGTGGRRRKELVRSVDNLRRIGIDSLPFRAGRRKFLTIYRRFS